MEYVGGYEDWVRVKKYEAAQQAPQREVPAKQASPSAATKAKSASKLSFKEQRELEEIPQRIAALEREQEEITATLSAANLYRDNPAHAKQLQERTSVIEEELLRLMARWEELESRAT